MVWLNEHQQVDNGFGGFGQTSGFVSRPERMGSWILWKYNPRLCWISSQIAQASWKDPSLLLKHSTNVLSLECHWFHCNIGKEVCVRFKVWIDINITNWAVSHWRAKICLLGSKNWISELCSSGIFCAMFWWRCAGYKMPGAGFAVRKSCCFALRDICNPPPTHPCLTFT